jgi:flagellar biosynthesis/type III secretory pathway chaperone
MSTEREGPDVRALLELERECCARLLPILDAERAAAASYDHVALLACLRERETLQAEWERVAERRRASLRDSGTSFAGLAANDARLAAVVADVRRDAARVRRAQRINEGVVRAALAHVTNILTVIRRELPDSRYDDRAVLRAPVPVASRWSA